ncbi:hypothetical protein LPJ81_004025 [Coemansia sp. IMI 209127]|nr:hypothetical protein LPJ81_004025 [Coemansia sp. IMI 209127]
MGRIRKKLACGSSPSSKTQPYIQLCQTRARTELTQPFSAGKDRNSTNVDMESTQNTSFHAANAEENQRMDKPADEELRLVGAGTSDNYISRCSNRMDDNWSPFDAPAVRQCLGTQPQTSPSLLERRENTPAYMPGQHDTSRQQMSGQRDPALFYRRYAGYMYAPESITLSIVDSETGEYLCQFPSR